MIAPNVLVAIVSFAAGVMASPCKPSSVTTATGTATTTTETATTTTSPAESVCLKSPSPAGKACKAQGGGDGDLDYLGEGDATSLANCLKSCQDKAGCVAFALSPDDSCALYGGIFTGTTDDETPWVWYEMDCFCDETSTITTVSATETTSTEATATEPTTSSAEFTSTTETMAAATTTAAVDSCVNNQKTPFPADRVCNKEGIQSGNLNFMGVPNAKTMESCRQGCLDNNGCTVFAFTPGQSCWIYSGTIDSVDDSQTDYIWYEMECFCDLDNIVAITTAEATTTADATTGAPTLTETAPVN
ncbi:hypothetical protein FSST1_009901 [Fusarium sambucinum]